MTVSKIKPALTPEEWARFQCSYDEGPKEVMEHWGRPHMVAALALHGQPFGFTPEDVEVVRHLAETFRVDYRTWKDGRDEEQKIVDAAISLAARIEALIEKP